MRRSDAAAITDHVGRRFVPAAQSKFLAVSSLKKGSDPEFCEKCVLTPNLRFAPHFGVSFSFLLTYVVILQAIVGQRCRPGHARRSE
jgi:hypothetical protein